MLQSALRLVPGAGGLSGLAVGARGGSRQVSSGAAQRLFDLFFLGQFFLVALVAPTFAAGSITGEKERKTYEMLLASPLEPMTILVGKLLSSLTYLVLLILSSLPLMILCFLLGGILLSEIARAYLILILAAGTFGLMSVACSSYFSRTSSALVVSYLVILPLALVCVALTRTDEHDRRATSSRSPSCRPGAWRSGRSWRSSSTAGCSARPTSAARARTSSTRSRR